MNVIVVDPSELRKHFIYDPQTGAIYKRLGDGTWTGRGRLCFNSNVGNYKGGRYKGEFLRAHRVAWAIHFGQWPGELQIDHINGDGRDNRIENLRLVSNLENCKNLGRRALQTPGPDSGVNGVYWHKQSRKWMARVKIKGKWIYLGTYTDLDEAVRIRKDAEKAYGFHANHGTRPAKPKAA
ncbi:MAG: HNH endonuclease [Mesorhizobium sp.]|nr:MAG: HNH endonuclease [Mesorhizobium sp.]